MRYFKRSMLFMVTLVVALFSLIGCKANEVKDITIDTSNLVLTINEGESFDFSNLKVVANYANKDVEVALSEVEVDTLLVDTTKAGEYSVTVRYKGFEKFFKVNVRAVVTLTSLEIDTSSCTIAINVGGAVDLANLKVKAVYSDGSKTDLSSNDYTVNQSAVNVNAVGTYAVKVTYQGVEKTFNVTVAPEDEPVLESIAVSGGKTNYLIGEEITLEGVSATAHYTKGEDKDVSSSIVLKEAVNTWEAGEKTVYVTYTEDGVTKETSFVVTVVDKIASVALNLDGVKVSYTPGETFSSEGIKLIATLKDDSKQELINFQVKVYDGENEFTGEFVNTKDYLVKVVYGDYEASYTVKVRQNGYVIVKTVEDFIAMRNYASTNSEKWLLANDLDFTGVELEEGTSSTFKGEFDGNGHKLSNIVFNTKTAKVGVLFNTIDGGTVKNLTFFSCYASTTAESLGLVTGLCTNGTFENLEFSCCTVVSTSSSGYASLIAGRNSSKGIINMKQITVKNLTSVSGVKYIGGLIADLTKDTVINIEDVDINISCKSGSQMSAVVGRARSGSNVNIKNAIIRFEILANNSTNKSGALVDGADSANLVAENVIIASSTSQVQASSLTQSGLFKGQGKVNATLTNCFYIGSPALANYAKTTDTELNDTKTYYELVNGEYVKVSTPDVANIATYYERSIDGGTEYIIGDTVIADLTGLGFDFTDVWEADSRFVVKLKAASANVPGADATITRIQVNANNAKVQYYRGEAFDATGLIVIATYSDGVVIPLEESQYTVKVFDNSDAEVANFLEAAVGKYYAKVEASGTSDKYNIDIVQEVGVEVIASEGRSVYRVGEVLDTKGVITFIKISDGTKKLATSTQISFKVEDKDGNLHDASETLSADSKFVVVSRNDLTAKYPIYVYDNEVSNGVVTVYVKPETNGLVEGKMFFEDVNLALDYLKSLDLASEVIKEIRVTKGSYYGAIVVDLPNVRLVKDSADDQTSDVIIVCDNASDTKKLDLSATFGTEGSATVTIKSSAVNFYAYGISFVNSFDYKNSTFANKQALALMCQADKAVFIECAFKGVQDTLEPKNGRQLYKDCYIEGAVDFIFGNNAVVIFDGCEIHNVTRYKTGTTTPESNQGYVCAPKGFSSGADTDAIEYGYVFLGCRFTADSDVPAGSVSLARPWGDQAKVAILNCELGAHISLAGYDGTTKPRYDQMSGNLPTGAGVKFVEYNNTGAGAINTPVAGATVLTEAEASKYTVENIFAAKNGKLSFDSAWTLPEIENGYYVVVALNASVTVDTAFTSPVFVYVTKGEAKEVNPTVKLYDANEAEVSLETFTATIGEYTLKATLDEALIYSTKIVVKADGPEAVVKEYILNISDLTAGDITADLAAGTNNFFNIRATSSNKLVVDAHSKTADGLSFTQRIKYGGTSKTFPTDRYIEFTTEGSAVVTIYSLSSSSSDNTRKVVIYDSVQANVGESTVDGKTLQAYTFTLPTAGTYYIGCEVNGINIYYVSVVDTVPGE